MQFSIASENKPTQQSRSWLTTLLFVMCVLLNVAYSFAAPTTPQSIQPPNGATEVTFYPTLEISCNTSETAAAQYVIASDPTFSTIVYDSLETTNDVCSHFAFAQLAADTQYFWQARIKNAQNEWSAWSSGSNFTTVTQSSLFLNVFQDGTAGYSGTRDADMRGDAQNPLQAIREWDQGAQDVLRTGRRRPGAQTDEITRSLIKFDLSALTDPDAVQNVYLEMTGHQHGHLDEWFPGHERLNSLYEVIRPWTEGNDIKNSDTEDGEVSWSYSAKPIQWSIPGVADANDTDPNADRKATYILKFVTTNEIGYRTYWSSKALVDTVKNWIANPTMNQGLFFQADDESIQKTVMLGSREHADQTFHPRLVIVSTEQASLGLNQPPVAGRDWVRTDQGTSIAIPVLSNDIDQDGAPMPLFIESVDLPTHGSANVVGDDILYVPDPAYFGMDHLNYTISDGQDRAVGVVNIEIQAGSLPGTLPLTITLPGAGNGIVSSDPAGLGCPSICTANFLENAQVVLTANPQADSTFEGWSGANCSGTGTCTVIMSQAESVEASFALLPPDTESPVVSIVAPTDGETLTGSVSLSASATDNVGVAGVQFLVNGVPVGAELTSVPWTMSWNSATVVPGVNTVSAQAYDAAGNTAVAPDVAVLVEPSPAFLQDNGPDRLVVVEAEHFHAQFSPGLHSWIETTPAGFSGDSAMVTDPNTGTNEKSNYALSSPRLDYEVNLTQTGFFYVWIRGIGASGGDDSVHIGLDGQELPTSDEMTGLSTNWTWSNQTMDGPVATLQVTTPGLHTLNLWMREDGTIIDKILLTTNPNYPTPTGNGPAESAQSSSPPPDPVLWPITLMLSGAGNGAMTSAPAGLSCPGTCTANFLETTPVVLTAVANPGSSFNGWSGAGCSGTGTCTIPITQAESVTADFSLLPPDTEAPVVSLITPTDGETVSGSVALGASATDNIGVVGVQFLLNGVPVGAELTSAPWTFSWDSTSVVPGVYTLSAQARDFAGNTALAPDVVVTVEAQTLLFSDNFDDGDLSEYGQVAGDWSTVSEPGKGLVLRQTTNAQTILYAAAENFSGSYQVKAEIWNEDNDTAAVAFRVNPAAPNNFYRCSATSDNGSQAGFFRHVNSLSTSTLLAGEAWTYVRSRWYTVTITVDQNANTLHCRWESAEAGVEFEISTVDPDPSATGTIGIRLASEDNFKGDLLEVAPLGTPPPPDTEAPLVSMTTPTEGQGVSGLVPLQASATDNVGVVGVQFLINGSPLGTELTSPPWTVIWDATTAAPGTYQVSAQARDATTNTTTSPAVSVVVEAPPAPVLWPLTLTLNGTGSGTITSSPVGISCPGTCTADFLEDTQVVLTALANPDSTFDGWSGAGCSGAGTCTVTLTQADSVTANFSLFSPPVTTGHLIVDPAHPEWFKIDDGNPFFLCGPGDPEDFLYRGTQNPDGTRTGDQMTLINKLAANGGNGLYFQFIRSHGGDGNSTHNPFVNNDPAQGLNNAVLDQWETWFTAMDQAGILIYAFFFDDSSKIWADGDAVPQAEQDFLEAIVNRFKHHTHLVWVIAEEYQESFTATRASNMAAIVRAADPIHPTAIHKLNAITFAEFVDDPNFDQFSIQHNVATPQALHDGMLAAWAEAAGRYNLNMSEAASHGTGSEARQKNWAVAMGGAYVMVLGWDIASTAEADLQDCGRLVSFMESTNFVEMSPRDDLAFGGTQYVLGDPTTQSYILYASALTGSLGVQALGAGTYDLHWLDIVSGTSVDQVGIVVAGGDTTFTSPTGIGTELTLWLRPNQGAPPPPDTTIPTITAPADVSVSVPSVPAIVAIGQATAEDLESGITSLVNNAPADFPEGTTTVTWTATNGAGLIATATQTVTVTVLLPPPPGLWPLTVTVTGNGTVTSAPAGITCPGTCQFDFLENTPVILTAVANSDSAFDGWTGAGCIGTGTCNVTLSQADSVTASFSLLPPPPPQSTLYSDNFDSGDLSTYGQISGDWSTVSEPGRGFVLRQTSNAQTILYPVVENFSGSYQVKAEIWNEDNDTAGVAFRVNPAAPNNFYSCTATADNGWQAGLWQHVNSLSNTTLLAGETWTYVRSRWYTVTITVDQNANTLHCQWESIEAGVEFEVTVVDPEPSAAGSVGIRLSSEDNFKGDLLEVSSLGPPPPPDAEAPVVSLLTPTEGETISGTVSLNGSATDNVGVVGVQFFVNGGPVGPEATSAPWTLAWNTASVAPGVYTISALARDAADNTTLSQEVVVFVEPTPGFVQDEGPDGLLVVEAEHFHAQFSPGLHSWIQTTPAGFSGDSAMVTDPNTGANEKSNYALSSPRMDYEVNFTRTGFHYVWIRGIGASGGDDSVHIGLNGQELPTSDEMTGLSTIWTWSNQTMDGSVATINVPSVGTHTLNLWMREDGAVIDKILLTTNPTYPTPTGQGPAESPLQ